MLNTILLTIWILLLGYGFQRRVSKRTLLITAILGTVTTIGTIINSGTVDLYAKALGEAIATITLWRIVFKQFKRK